MLVTRSGILRKYLPVAKNTVPMAINQDIKALIPNSQVSADYLLQILSARGPGILSTCMKTGTTVESVEYTWLKRYQIPLPSLPEQRAIATALSDVDGLITSLDRIIAKKRDIKQATMQQLLTGKKRLPGFGEELKLRYKQTEAGVIPKDWNVTKLGEIADVKTGPFGSALHEKDYVDDGTPIITVEHLGEQGVLYVNLPMVSDLDRKRLHAYTLLKGDIVLSRVGSVDRNSLIKE